MVWLGRMHSIFGMGRLADSMWLPSPKALNELPWMKLNLKLVLSNPNPSIAQIYLRVILRLWMQAGMRGAMDTTLTHWREDLDNWLMGAKRDRKLARRRSLSLVKLSVEAFPKSPNRSPKGRPSWLWHPFMELPFWQHFI